MSSPTPTLSRCSECGHEHWNEPMKQYHACPLATEGCECPARWGDAGPAVIELRAMLNGEGYFWMLVRGHAQATFLPDNDIHTIWWDFETRQFVWGHHLEYHDPDAQAVIARLKEITNV